MKSLLLFAFAAFVLQSCDHSIGVVEAAHDNLNYESITGSRGTVYVTRGKMDWVYDSAKVIYSEADATTMLIKTKQGQYVYIQGPAVIEFDDFDANDR